MPDRSAHSGIGALRSSACLAVLVLVLCSAAGPSLAQDVHDAIAAAGTDEALRGALSSFGPWPAPVVRDTSNRVSGDPAAIAFGAEMFESPRLSGRAAVRCASCHEPWRAFSDGRARAHGTADGSRRTPSLYDVRLLRSYGWDGANDTLWGQVIRPLIDRREMDSSPARIAHAVRSDPHWSREYRALFGHAPADDLLTLADVAKAISAYLETLDSPVAPFDLWRDAELAGRPSAYPDDARRGFVLFVGRAGCGRCHSGPTFSDGRFHRSLVRSATVDGSADRGRADGVMRLAMSAFTRAGRYSDAPMTPVAMMRLDDPDPVNRFRTPGLRGVAARAPYMHDGSTARLCDALLVHASVGTEDLRGPSLSAGERHDLMAFLQSLGAPLPASLEAGDAWRCDEPASLAGRDGRADSDAAEQ